MTNADPRNDLSAVKEGDTLTVYTPSRGRYSEPRIEEGTVTKAARVWLTVETVDTRLGRERKTERRFRRDTGNTGSDHSGTETYVYLPEAWAVRQAKEEATNFLHEQGIDLRPESRWRGREIELAATLALAEGGW